MDKFTENIQIYVTVGLFPTSARKQSCKISTSKKTLVKRTVTWLSAKHIGYLFTVRFRRFFCSSCLSCFDC